MVEHSVRIRRFRGTRKRLERLKLDRAEILAGLAIASFCLLCSIVCAWLVVSFGD